MRQRPIRMDWLEELLEELPPVETRGHRLVEPVSGLHLQSSNREVVWNSKTDYIDDAILDGWDVRGIKGADGLNRCKWPARLYALRNVTMRRMRLHRAGVEHDLYANLDGSFTLEDFFLERAASQGLQLVYRESETARPHLAKELRTVLIRRGAISDCGRPNWAWKAGSSRPASALSVFRCGELVEITLEDVHLRSYQTPFGKAGWRSFGAVLLQDAELADVRGCTVDYAQPSDRPVVIVERVKALRLQDVAVWEGRIWLEGVQDLEVSDCYGKARVIHNGRDLGELGQLSAGGVR